MMKIDPIYLFQVLPQKASLGVLSIAGNVCRVILSEKWGGVKLWLALGLECLGEFSAVYEVEEERFGSINDVLEIDK